MKSRLPATLRKARWAAGSRLALLAVGTVTALTISLFCPVLVPPLSAQLPPPAYVYDGLGADEDWTGSTNTLSGNWGAVAGAAYYEYAIGTTPGGADVVALTNVGPNTSFTRSDLSLADGVTYYISARGGAPIGAGLSATSDGIRADLAAPSSSVSPLAPTQSSTSFTVTWSGFDAGSGIQSYDVQYQEDAGPWTDWETYVSKTGDTFTGTAGHTYGFRSRARDNVGNVEGYPNTPDAFTEILVQFPAPAYVYDGSGADEDWTSSTNTLSGNWASVPTAANYEYCIGTTSGSDNVVGWTQTGGATSFTRPGLSLLNGQTYYISARVFVLGAPAQQSATSDGITADLAAPSSSVSPLAPTQTSTTFTVNWSGSDGTGSGILSYDIEYQEDGGQWMPWLLGTTQTSSSFTGNPGGTYGFRSRARDVAGNVEAYPAIPDATTQIQGIPAPAYVNDGVGADEDWTNAPATLSGNWAIVAGASDYQYCIGTTSGGQELVAWNSVGNVASFTRSDLSLQDARTYYISARGSIPDFPGATGTSDGITTDFRAPESQVLPLPQVEPATIFTVSWTGTDQAPVGGLGSGIESYDIQYQKDTGFWTDWRTSTTATSASFTGEPGSVYNFRSRARDRAGNVEQYPQTPDAVTQVAATAIQPGAVTLSIRPYPSSFVFYPGEASKAVTYDVSVVGPTGATLQRLAQTFRFTDGTSSTAPTIPISGTVQPGMVLKVPGTVEIPEAIRTRALGTRTEASLTIDVAIEAMTKSSELVTGTTSLSVLIRTLPAGELVLSVQATPTVIDFPAGVASRDVTCTFSMPVGAAATGARLTTYTTTWITEEGTPLDRLTSSTDIRVPSVGSVEQTLGMALSEDLRTRMLSGAESNVVSLALTFSGTDDAGRPASAGLQRPLAVTVLSALVEARPETTAVPPETTVTPPVTPPVTEGVLVVTPSPLDFNFYPGTTARSITYTLHNTGTTAIHVNGLAGRFVDAGGLEMLELPSRTVSVDVPAGGVAEYRSTVEVSDSNREILLGGAVSARIGLEQTFSGTLSDGSPVSADVSPRPDLLLEALPPTQSLAIVLSPVTVTLGPADSTFTIDASLTAHTTEEVRFLTEEFEYRYGSGSETGLTTSAEAPVAAGATRATSRRMELSSATRFNILGGHESARAVLAYTFNGTTASGVPVSGEGTLELIVEAPPAPVTLAVTPSLGTLTYRAGETEKSVTFTARLSGSAGATLQNENNRFTYRGTTDDSPVTTSEPHFATSETRLLSRTVVLSESTRLAALAGRDTARIAYTFTLSGTADGGAPVQGSCDIVVLINNVSPPPPPPPGQSFVLIPGVAYIIPGDGTSIRSASATQILDGIGDLLLVIPPFDSLRIPCNLSSLQFLPDVTDPTKLIAQAGSLLGDGTPSSPLFSIFGALLEVVDLSFDAGRTDKLRIDLGRINVPFVNEFLDVTNCRIDGSGVHLTMAEQEVSLFALTFRLTDIQTGFEGSKYYISFNAGVRLAGKPRDQELAQSRLKFLEGEGIQGRFALSSPVDVVPGLDVLQLSLFEFTKEGEVWYLNVGGQVNLPGVLADVGWTPFTFKIDKNCNVQGQIVPLRETTAGLEGDRSQLGIGDFCTIDLTYLGIQLRFLNGQIDNSRSLIQACLDVYFPRYGSWDGRVSLGTLTSTTVTPGITITFGGDVSTDVIAISGDEKISLDAVYLHLTALTLRPYPFEFSLSGGFGIAISDAFEGELNFEGLRVAGDGVFQNLGSVIRGGGIDVLSAVHLSVGGIEYSNRPTTIEYRQSTGESTNPISVSVLKYFRLTDATIGIGSGDDGGSGGVDELLIFTTTSGHNFVIRNAYISIQEVVEIEMDLEFIQAPEIGSILRVAGSATIPNDIGAVIIGKVGQNAEGDATFGFFVAVRGLTIPIGPVILTDIGGGFFYNPEEYDLQLVRDACNFDRPEMDEMIQSKRPGGADNPGSFAVMIYGGVYVVDRALIKGRLLLTLTQHFINIDAEAELLAGIATGKFYLGIGWEPEYAEGRLEIEVDIFSLIKGSGELEFFVYPQPEGTVWGIMGSANLDIFYIVRFHCELFIGPPGFLLETEVHVGIDLGILSGSAGWENMFWYKAGSSWGAYTKLYFNGEILWGLIGLGGSLEGALIGGAPHLVVYLVGTFRAEICWIEVFNGSLWITVGDGGLDGGTGRNAKYDALIEEARNMANEMQEQADAIQEQIREARDALLALSEEQRRSAGDLLVEEMGGSTILVGLVVAGAEMGYPMPEALRTVVREILNDPTAEDARRTRNALKDERVQIDSLIVQADSVYSQVRDRLSRYDALLETAVPSIAELGQLGNPTTATSATRTVMGRTVTVKDYTVDDTKAGAAKSALETNQEESAAFEQALFDMVAELEQKLFVLDSLLLETESGVPSLTRLTELYVNDYLRMNGYYTNLLDYLALNQNRAAGKRGQLAGMETGIRTALETQAGGLTGDSARRLATQRRRMINALISRPQPEDPFFETDYTLEYCNENYSSLGYTSGREAYQGIWRARCVEPTGMELYYHIPMAGFVVIIEHMVAGRADSLLSDFRSTVEPFAGKWEGYTVELDRVYDLKAQLYEVLYDLYDQLSMTASRFPGSRAARDTSGIRAATVAVFVTGTVGPSGTGTTSGSGTTIASSLTRTVTTTPISGSGLLSSSSGTVAFGSATAAAASRTVASSTSLSGTLSGIGVSGTGPITGTTPSGAPPTGPVVTEGRGGAALLGPIIPGNYTNPRAYFAAKRDQVGRFLEIPQLTQLAGTCRSEKVDFARVQLWWEASHPFGVADYAYRIEKPAPPSSIRGFTGVTGEVSPTLRSSISTSTATATPPPSGTTPSSTITSVPTTLTGEVTSRTPTQSATLVATARATLSPTIPLEWRSMGQLERLDFSLLRPVDDEGLYALHLRARGAGGYTTERRGTFSLRYYSTDPDDPESETIREASLNTADSTPPVRPWVSDDGRFSASRSFIHARWGSSDLESGIAEYQYQVGTYSRPSGTLEGGSIPPVFVVSKDWTSTGGITDMNIRGLDLAHNTNYFVRVRARNNVGAWSVYGQSDGILVDTTRATMPEIVEFHEGGAGGVTTPRGQLYASWSPSRDPETGVAGYKYMVGTTAGGADLVPETFTTRTSATMTRLSLATRATYYLTVAAVNGASALSEPDTASTFIPLGDVTPPPVSPVVTASLSGGVASVSWSLGVADPESGVLGFSYALYSGAPGSKTAVRVTPWVFAGLKGSGTIRYPFTPGQAYHVVVQVTNGVGLVKEGASTSISVIR